MKRIFSFLQQNNKKCGKYLISYYFLVYVYIFFIICPHHYGSHVAKADTYYFNKHEYKGRKDIKTYLIAI